MTKINWDCEDIYDLEKLLAGMTADELRDIKWDDLPTADIPDDIDTTEVWAMDKKGRLLYGPISDAIEFGFDRTDSVITLDQLREKQDSRLSFDWVISKGIIRKIKKP